MDRLSLPQPHSLLICGRSVSLTQQEFWTAEIFPRCWQWMVTPFYLAPTAKLCFLPLIISVIRPIELFLWISFLSLETSHSLSYSLKCLNSSWSSLQLDIQVFKEQLIYLQLCQCLAFALRAWKLFTRFSDNLRHFLPWLASVRGQPLRKGNF